LNNCATPFYLKVFQEFHLLKWSSSFLALFSATDNDIDFGALPIFSTFLLRAITTIDLIETSEADSY